MTVENYGTEELARNVDHNTLQRSWAVRDILAAAWMEVGRIRNHFFRTTLAGSPFIPYFFRWGLYRIMGLRIYTPYVREQCVMHNRYLEIGPKAFVNRGCLFEGSGRIVIGERARIGPQCTFLTSHHDVAMIDDQLAIASPMARDIVIGARVWVGGRTTFLPGSSVEDDVVIAAGAVVSGHLTKGWIYGGIPAKRIRIVQDSLPSRSSLSRRWFQS
jgi:maltose O-acetyltransferase